MFINMVTIIFKIIFDINILKLSKNIKNYF